MKKLRPNFLRSKRFVSVAFFIAAVILFFAPALHAGQIPSPPKWIPFEMKAVTLCQAGINQQSSDPQAAVTTLRQARLASTAAITNGGGTSSTVLHNDQVIAHALMMALADAAKAPENKPVEQVADTPHSGGIKLLRPPANHIQATIYLKRAVK